MAHLKIFISCVSREFASYRDLLRRYLTRPNVTVQVQEDFIDGALPTLDKLDHYITQCDAVIHIAGDMTGAMAKPSSVALIAERYPDLVPRFPELKPAFDGTLDVSYTQWEAYLALYHKKPLLIATPAAG